MDTSKIIKGIVNGRNYTVTSPIVKEDYGLYLQIEGVELPSTYEVDFSNSENSGTSVTMIGNADGVLIPHQFIDTGKDIFAFLYHVGEDFGRTVYKFRIPNKVRPDRTDETPTPEEQSVIDQTIAALNEAVESTQEAQEAIENMSVSAQTLAEGESATVTKTESEGVVHLEFGIPTGATGAQGAKGDKGDTGEVAQAEFDELSGEVSDLKEGLTSLEEHLHYENNGSVNLFDPNNPNEVALIPKSGGTYLVTYSGAVSIWLKVKPNSTVTLDSKTDGNRCQAFTFTSIPQNGSAWVNTVSAGYTASSVTITTGETDVYVLFYLSTSACDYSEIRVFYGTEWTSESTSDVTRNAEAITVLQEDVADINEQIDGMASLFLHNLTEGNVFNLLSYRPLGLLTKPYIAFSCDDGASPLATVTIPRFKGYKSTYNKNIPITMGLMTGCAVLTNDTYKSLVQEMISDYGCDVAVHGASSYTSYTNDELIAFLDEQDTQLTALCGKKPVGCIYPNHTYNLEKSVIAGSYYGLCAGGYSNGVKYTQCCGARSNMYELHRWSLFGGNVTNAIIELYINYAVDNNMLLMPWFHDVDLTGANAERNLALLDYCVEYGISKGINFISYGEIKGII